MKTKLLQLMTKIRPALVLAALLLFLGAMLPLQAQNDTLGKNPHLYYYQMPELGHHDTTTCYINAFFSSVDYSILSQLLDMNVDGDEYALYMHSDDTIQIVGIAYLGWQGVGGTYYRMSLYDDTMKCLASTEVSTFRPDTLDSNWLPIYIPNDIHHVGNPTYNPPNLALRLAFFDDTIAISGGFYLGSMFLNGQGYYVCGPLLTLYEDHPAPYAFPSYSARVHDIVTKEWIDFGMDFYYGDPVIPLFFPILSSYPRSNSGTTGIAETTAADRQVGLSPNPAAGRVEVTASCGMTEVAVYNATGEQVLRQPASGHSATLDTSRWPAGVYVVHVETPLGRAVKKLVVR